MRISIENTCKVVELDGVECRIWEGVTCSGVVVPLHAFIARIAIHEDDDNFEIQRELRAGREPSAEVDAYPDELTTPKLCPCCASHFDECQRCAEDPRRNILAAVLLRREPDMHAMLRGPGHGPTVDRALHAALGALLHTWPGVNVPVEAVDLGAAMILIGSATKLIEQYNPDATLLDELRALRLVLDSMLTRRIRAEVSP